jgi:hypothetical protein
MGIKVEHRMSGDVVGTAAYASGAAQGQERRRQQDREYNLQQEVNAIREKARQDANARFYAQLQAQTEARNEDMAFRQQQYEELPERQMQLGQIDNSLKKDLSEWEYSRAQQRQLQKLAEARDTVTRNADGLYTPKEQDNLLRQIDAMEHGMTPVQRKTETPWSKEQDSGRVWVDENSGATLTRDDKGNVKVLVKPDDSTSFANRLKLKETIAKHAKDIYDSLQLSENPLSMEEALKTAEQFYSDLMPQPQGNSAVDGDAEAMADFMLRHAMSPETYAAAKATGLPSTDIYYMTQQLMNQGGQPDAATSAENGGINKEQWMANTENFNQYRQRFASGVPQSQVEEAYKNDPYVDSNNSLLADTDHEVATDYATWEELTDHQREKAYAQYLKQNKLPLGDRIAMNVAKVISKSDYKNYQKKEAKHKAKLLTEEQFNQKCTENPEFLWQFIKAPNRPVPAKVNATQADMHRAIDASRKPVFGGL